MKLKIVMKDPDAIDYMFEEFSILVEQELSNLNDEEKELIIEHRKNTIKENLYQWFNYLEILNLDYDTEKDTLTVVRNKE